MRKAGRLPVRSPAHLLTHLAVEPRHRLGLGRVVPLCDVPEGQIRLWCTVAEFAQLGPAKETQRWGMGEDESCPRPRIRSSHSGEILHVVTGHNGGYVALNDPAGGSPPLAGTCSEGTGAVRGTQAGGGVVALLGDAEVVVATGGSAGIVDQVVVANGDVEE